MADSDQRRLQCCLDYTVGKIYNLLNYLLTCLPRNAWEPMAAAVHSRRGSGTESGGGSAFDPPPLQSVAWRCVDDYRTPGRTSVPSTLTALSSRAGRPSSLRIVGAIWAVSTWSFERSGATPAPQTTMGTCRSCSAFPP